MLTLDEPLDLSSSAKLRYDFVGTDSGANASIAFKVGAADGRESQAYSLRALVQTGDDFDRYFKEMQVSRDRITLTGGLWVKTDAHCCPSRTATAIYRFSSHGLDEVSRSITRSEPGNAP